MITEKRLHYWVLAGLGLAALAAYGLFLSPTKPFNSLGDPSRYNSPDETANAFWAERVRTYQPMMVIEPLNLQVGNAIHLRSDNVRADGNIVPGGFWGLSLWYGLIGRIFGWLVMQWLTPLLAVLAAWCSYGLIRRLWNRQVAIVSVALLLICPAWWYYAARGWLPNVAFVSLLVIAAWWWLAELPSWSGNKKRLLRAGLGAICLGMAIIIRPAELPWLIVAVVAGSIVTRRQWCWSEFSLVGIIGVIMAAAGWGINQQLYGSGLSTGYQDLIAVGQAASSLWSQLSLLLLPFGIHVRPALRHVWQYGGQLLWWYSWPILIGVIATGIMAWRRKQQQILVAAIAWLVLAGWLIIVYGGWEVKDNISGHITIGTSYVRYWLPIIVTGIPFFAWLVVELIQKIPKRSRATIVGVLFGVLAALSVNLTVQSEEGLMAVRSSIYSYKRVARNAPIEIIHAVVISDRSDKIFWPQWRVATYMGDISVFARLKVVADILPVYYYSHNELTPANLEQLKSKLVPLELDLWLEPFSITATGVDRFYRLRSL